jgi:hypothetical protein
MKKSPHALVPILSPGGDRGDFTFYPLSTTCLPTVKKPSDDIINKSANQTANLQCGVLHGNSKATTHESVVSGEAQVSQDLSQGSMSAFL